MIYLDYNATTPIDHEVAAVMRPFLEGEFGNPSSIHAFGVQAKKAIEKARQQVATFLNCAPTEIIFTSGGTESNNLAIRGIASALKEKGNHIITSAVEHPAVSEVCNHLSLNGFEISYLGVDKYGVVDPASLEKAIKPNTILISIMHANNETGTIQPITLLAEIARKNNIVFHTDAAQSAGKIPVDVAQLGIDLLSLAGHKLYAPKGIGALYIRKGTRIDKLMFGADHEQNLRPGTENVLEIAGLGKACEIASRDLLVNQEKYGKLRDMLYKGIRTALPDIKRNGHPDETLPNTLSISFPGVEANTLVSRLDGLAVSAGAACHADNIDVSAVLKAMAIPLRYAMGTIRFSVGKYNSESEIQLAIDQVSQVAGSLLQVHEKNQKTDEEIKLTHYTHGLGCACKIDADKLSRILVNLPVSVDPNILVGTRTSDDASVYRLTDEIAIVQTLDFFTPVVDDPYDFGAIAAANALSDVYAMGAKPLYAQNIVGFPEHTLPIQVLEQILKGASDKAAEAGIEITGGHSIEDPEPKYGMVVTGIVHPSKFIKNFGARPGDVLILTKPLGSGIMTTALKRGLLDESARKRVTAIMSQLNKEAAETMLLFPVSACTDVTGFGLLGHLREMSKASECDVQLYFDRIPFMDGVEELAADGIIPGGSKLNARSVANFVEFSNQTEFEKLMLADAQTSGGLLIAISAEHETRLLKALKANNCAEAVKIGTFTQKGEGIIRIIK